MIASAKDTLPRFDADRIEMQREIAELRRQVAENTAERKESSVFRVKVKTAVAVILAILSLGTGLAAIIISLFKQQ